MLMSLNSGIWITSPEDYIPRTEKTVCITGHRAKNVVPFRGDPSQFRQTVCCVRMILGRYIDLAYRSGYTDFMDGLASGTDLWAAKHIMRRKKEGWNIRLIGVMPYLRHAEFFSRQDKETLTEAELACDVLICTESDPDMTYSHTGEGSSLYRIRNYYMADRSAVGIAFFNSDSRRSGTGQTVARLRSQGKDTAVFGCEDAHRIMERAGADITKFSRYIADIPDPFSGAPMTLPGFI